MTIEDPSLSAHGYQFIVAPSNQSVSGSVSDNREFDVLGIF